MFCFSPRKAYISPALLWLEEEGLRMEAGGPRWRMEALGGEIDKEEVMDRAMKKWKRKSVKEKAVWRAKAKEGATTNQK